MLIGGLVYLVNPRGGFQWWDRTVRPRVPSYFHEVADDYSHLSDRSLRYTAFWEVVLGAVLLRLASK